MKPLVIKIRVHTLTLVISSILSSGAVVPVAGVGIRTQVDNVAPQVAEPFWFTITVEASDDATVVFSEVPVTIGVFHVLSHRDWFDVPVGNERSWTRNFELESLQGGDLQIPSISVSVGGDTLSSEPVAITIASAVEADASPYVFRDIKTQVDIPVPPSRKTHWMAWISLAGLLASSMAVATWFLRRNRTLAPGAWALQQLEQLRNAEEFHHAGAPKLVPEIASILRRYFERQFEIRATRQTTNEFLANAQHDRRLTAEQQSLLQKFLQHVDEIKFAHLHPEVGRLDDSYRLVQDFVRSTSGDV